MVRRKALLGLALAATVLVSIWAAYVPEVELAPQAGPQTPIRVAHREAQPVALGATAGPVETAAADRLQMRPRQAPVAGGVDLFDSKDWDPPPTAAAAAAPPPPSLPFAYSGRLEIDGRQSVLLAEGARMHIVALHDEVSGFTLDGIDEGELVFAHRASGQRVTLPLKP